MTPPITQRKPAPSRTAPSCAARPTDVLRRMRLDVGQIEALISDAITHLTTSFEQLHAAYLAQQRLLVDGAVATSAGQCPEIDALGASADRAIDQAVTALQFHDITSQLLAQLGSRIDTLYPMVAAIGDREDASDADDRHESPAHRTTRVTQTGMTAGTIQLF